MSTLGKNNNYYSLFSDPPPTHNHIVVRDVRRPTTIITVWHKKYVD